jgi:hypothetical protein
MQGTPLLACSKWTEPLTFHLTNMGFRQMVLPILPTIRMHETHVGLLTVHNEHQHHPFLRRIIRELLSMTYHIDRHLSIVPRQHQLRIRNLLLDPQD